MAKKNTEVVDLVVVGGGLAGTCAAIAAARLGSRVALVTNRPVLGGNSSSEIRVWVVGATAHGAQRFARETGIIGELFLENQYRNPEGNPVLWDQVVLDAVRAEPNISLHLNTDVHDLVMTHDLTRIQSVQGWNMQTETWTTFTASVFADCTGDGLMGELAGASYMTGREGRDDFGEEWAPEKPDKEYLGSSMFFYTKDTGKPVRFVPPNIAKDITQTPIVKNRIIRTGDNGCAYWWIEWGGQLDIVNDSDKIQEELVGVIYGIWNYIKNSGKFDADNFTLEWVGTIPGRREYRRFIGDYVLTQQDLMEQRDFNDAVTFGGWSIDLHPSGGMYAMEAGARQRYANGPYQIPFRALYSRDIDNMLMAGRDISATHIAEGSTRVMATCASEGQVIGTAAAVMARKGIGAKAVESNVGNLQQVLLREDGPIIGVPRRDSEDLLSYGSVTASSYQHHVESIDVDSIDANTSVTLDTDIAIIIPVDPTLVSVDILIDSTEDTELTFEAWDTDKPQNYVPVHRHATRTVPVSQGGDEWVSCSFNNELVDLSAPCNVVIVVKANSMISLHMTSVYPYGLMMLRRKKVTDGNFDPLIPDEPNQLLTTWIARKDRGHVPILRVAPATAVYSPESILDAYQRPYGGVHMWVSELPHRIPSIISSSVSSSAAGVCLDNYVESRTTQVVNEWIDVKLPKPQTIASVRIVFNDDVDADLINLHHHLTPWPVVPTLIADYSLEGHRPGESSDTWEVLAVKTNNRHRHAIHDFEPRVLDRLRIVITATNGSPYASVSSIKAYSHMSKRISQPWI